MFEYFTFEKPLPGALRRSASWFDDRRPSLFPSHLRHLVSESRSETQLGSKALLRRRCAREARRSRPFDVQRRRAKGAEA
jgi:hypothetical protein